MGTETPEEDSMSNHETDTNSDSEVNVSEQRGDAPKKREVQPSFFERRHKSPTVEIVERDLEVLDFILDMKFATAIDIYERFYARSFTISPSPNQTRWAKYRLMQLERSGFLRAFASFGKKETLYVATPKSYYTLNSVYPSETRPKPSVGIDIRTYSHDRELIFLRLDYERNYQNISWISDRRLRQNLGETLGLNGPDVPDAIIRLPDIGLVAVELEIAQKARARYKDKIARYVRLIREPKDQSDGIKKVIYHCLKKQVFEILKSETRIFGTLFDVIQTESRADKRGL